MRLKNLYKAIVPTFEKYGFTPPSDRRELQGKLTRSPRLDSMGSTRSVFLAASEELECQDAQPGRGGREHRSHLRTSEELDRHGPV